VTQHLPTERHTEGRSKAFEQGHGYYSELENYIEYVQGENNGCDSPDVKGSANSGEGDDPSTHISDVCDVDHEDRQSVTSAVNEGADTSPSLEEIPTSDVEVEDPSDGSNTYSNNGHTITFEEGTEPETWA
jgi:hypothetical protein